jgi:predicted nucleic acid-binding protein
LIVLDSWALLAYLKDEPAAGRIEEVWISEGAAICTLNLGEALYMRIRERGEKAAVADIEKIRRRSKVLSPDWALIRSAARVKAGGGLSYADAFCVATTLRLKAPLWTGDPEIVELAESLRCEVVDLRV